MYFMNIFFIYFNMNNQSKNEYNRLSFENIIAIVFIVLNILNIKTNEQVKSSIVTGEQLPKETMSIFKLIITITVLAYIYYVIRNYGFYINSTTNANKSGDPRIQYIRLIGSIFILIGGILLMYTVYKDAEAVTSTGDIEL